MLIDDWAARYRREIISAAVILDAVNNPNLTDTTNQTGHYFCIA